MESDERHHLRLALVDFLGSFEDFGGLGGGDADDTVFIGDDDVAGFDFDAGALDGYIASDAGETADGAGGDDAAAVDGQAKGAHLFQIADAAVDDDAGHATSFGGGSHQASDAGDVKAVLDDDNADFAGVAVVDHGGGFAGGEGRGGFFGGGGFDEDGDGAADGAGGDGAGAHVVGHETALAGDLVDGVGDGGDGDDFEASEEGVFRDCFAGGLEAEAEESAGADGERESFVAR